MKKVAFISAAGWKRSGDEHGLADCPEPLLPLGDGTTSLYRTARVLSALDFDVYIAMAPIGYRFDQHWAMFTEDQPLLEGSPWTQERVDYVSKLGTVIHVPNPGRTCGAHSTFCEMMEVVTDWDHLFLARGDMVYSEGHLARIITTLPWPSQYQVAPTHGWLLLDKSIEAAYLSQVAPFHHTTWESRKIWSTTTYQLPDGYPQGTHKFGLKVFNNQNGPVGQWLDIDNVKTYKQALAGVADGTFAWEEPNDGS